MAYISMLHIIDRVVPVFDSRLLHYAKEIVNMTFWVFLFNIY